MARRALKTKPIIRDGKTVESLVTSIADKIIGGELQPGEKLDEVSLASLFGVSRTPIREALRLLSATGLVARTPNRSAVVAMVTQRHLASMFEAMAELESICARMSAERMTVSERRALEEMHIASAQLVRQFNEAQYEAYNIEFHSALYRGAHNDHICELASQTRSRLAPFRRAQFRLEGRIAKSFQEHDAIVTAILRADGSAAGKAAYAHVSIVSDASSVFAGSATST